MKGLSKTLTNNLAQVIKRTLFKISAYSDRLEELAETILDVLYPQSQKCVVCDNKANGHLINGICSNCMQFMPFINEDSCLRCGKALVKDKEKCMECDGITLYFEQAMSVFEYSPALQRLIYRFKYGEETYLYRNLGDFMAQKLKSNISWDYDFLIPVPLHKKRSLHRGYNQAYLLTKSISQSLNVHIAKDVLHRTKDTMVQAGLKKTDRLENLKGAFEVSKGNYLKDKKIVLVDDIYTTGSTVNECSRVLREAGAEKVYVLALAAGRPAKFT